jgi:hypothetical protein
MDRRDSDKKQLKRLQLRREVIRVLADDSLSRVAGGIVCGGDPPTAHCSPCVPSK